MTKLCIHCRWHRPCAVFDQCMHPTGLGKSERGPADGCIDPWAAERHARWTADCLARGFTPEHCQFFYRQARRRDADDASALALSAAALAITFSVAIGHH